MNARDHAEVWQRVSDVMREQSEGKTAQVEFHLISFAAFAMAIANAYADQIEREVRG